MIAACRCPLCAEGQIGFRYCSSSETMVLLCDSCGFVWLHPSRLEPEQAEDPIDNDFLRKHPACQLRPSRWATEEEIREYGWGAYLLRPADLG